MVRLHKPILEPLGLTFPQYLVMLELLDGAPVSVGILGNRLGMDTGTITPLVKRLEGAGFVTRTRDPGDERRVMVDLTPVGRALESDIRRVPDRIKSLCQLTEGDFEELRVTLDGLGIRQSNEPKRSARQTLLKECDEGRNSRDWQHWQNAGAQAERRGI